ncbi:MAG: hypothetical protein NTW32_26740 [Chloroflexi bacterium]|nr:hypothetical protein [Chloroflexota bacterium]
MIGKLFGLIGKLIGLALLALIVGVVALAGYFYYKSGEPMQVAEAQRLAPGITLREYWQFTHAVWEKADDKSVSDGNNRSCVLVYGIVDPIVGFFSVPFQVNHFRAIRGTPAFANYAEYLNGNVPPDKLLSSSWWMLPEAYWWQYENLSWFTTYLPGGNCRVRPLSPSAHSKIKIP